MRKLIKKFPRNLIVRLSIPLSLISLVLLIYNKWFFNLAILAAGDWVFFFKETMATIRLPYFSIWYGDFFGMVLLDAGQAPTWALYGFLAKYLSFDYALSERLIHFWPVAIFTPLFSYLLLRKLFKSKIAIFVGVLVYSFNTYFLLLQAGTLTLMAAFSFAPIIILEYIKTFETLKLKHAIFTGLLLFIASAYEPRGFYIIAWILFIYFIYNIILLKDKLSKNAVKICFYGFLPIFIVGLLSFYWIFGILNLTFLSTGIPIGRSLFGSEFYNVLYALTLFHPFWTGSLLTIFIVQNIPIYFWIIPVFAFLGLWLNRKNIYIMFFGIIAILGIFLTKQTGVPFSGAYAFLYKFLPGFAVFREASKFYFLIALGYAVLIGAFVEWMWINWSVDKKRVYLKYLLTFVIAIIFLWNTKPLITGEIQTLFVPKKVPYEYLIFKDFLLKQQDFFRTIGIPSSSNYLVSTNTHPRADWELFYYVNEHSVREKVINNKLTTGQVMVSLLSKPYSNNLLNISSIKYILIPLSDNVNDDDLFINSGEDREYYIKSVDKITYLKKVNVGTNNLVVYENKSYRPLIYLTSEKETIYKNVPYKKIKYSFLSPTEYKLSLKSVLSTFYINFSESYTPDWRLRVGIFNWYDVLTKKNYFIPNTHHFQNDASLNSFYIDTSMICKVESCSLNKDGSYDIDLTLYFAPQAYMNLGLIISGSTLVVVLGYLFFIFGKHMYGKIK